MHSRLASIQAIAFLVPLPPSSVLFPTYTSTIPLSLHIPSYPISLNLTSRRRP